MATVIDSLIIELGLDPRAFTRGQKEAASSFLKTKEESTRLAKEMEERGKQAARFFTRLRNEALALFAAFKLGEGIKSFVSYLVGNDADIFRWSQKLEMSTKELGTWRNAVEMVGGTAQGATQSLANLTSELQQYRLTGTMGQALQVFNRFGINIYDMNGKLKSAGQLFRELHQAIQGMDPREARELLRMAGADEGMTTLLMQNTEAFKKLWSAAAANAPSEAAARAAARLQASWNQLDQSLTALGRQIVLDLAPTIMKVLTLMERWIARNREWMEQKIKEAIREFVNAVRQIPWSDIVRGAEDFANALLGVHNYINGILGTKGEIELFFGLWVGAKIAAAIGGVGALGVALAALTVPLKLLTGAGAVINTLIAAGSAGVAASAAAPGAVTAGAVAAVTALKGDVADIPPEMMAKYKSGEAHASVFGYLGDLFKSTFGRGDGATVNNDNSRSAQTVINGPIIIQAQGADAKSVYVDLVDAIKQRGLATQQNTGPN